MHACVSLGTLNLNTITSKRLLSPCKFLEAIHSIYICGGMPFSKCYDDIYYFHRLVSSFFTSTHLFSKVLHFFSVKLL